MGDALIARRTGKTSSMRSIRCLVAGATHPSLRAGWAAHFSGCASLNPQSEICNPKTRNTKIRNTLSKISQSGLWTLIDPTVILAVEDARGVELDLVLQSSNLLRLFLLQVACAGGGGSRGWFFFLLWRKRFAITERHWPLLRGDCPYP